MKYHRKKFTVILLVCCILLCIAAGCSSQKKAEITSFDQLKEPGMKIGVSISTPEEAMLAEDYPDAEVIPYTELQLGIKDVENGRADIYVDGLEYLEQAIANGATGVHVLDEVYAVDKVAIGISPKTEIPDLEKKINAFIKENKENGTLGDIYDRWTVQDKDEMPEIEMPENPKYHLKVGTTGLLKPFSYYEGTELTGCDIEIAYRLAAYLDADVTFKTYDWGGVVAAGQTGDVDCIMSNLYVTPERAEAVNFSDPLSETPVGAVVRNADAAGGGAFWSSVKESFEKTFIRGSRWKLFVRGIGTTLLITVMAILLGTLLGFAVFMACRNGNRIANAVTRFCVWLVQGMPVVVLLMILYYLIFGRLEISGTLVAIIAFTLIFGASVYSMLKTGVSAVDIGQTEAAYTLGYRDRPAFFKVVLPQALPLIMPVYLEGLTTLLKATAVVGYIAVQDLTKMGDIVRSRTYDAFFPLISVAVFYFILAALLSRAVKRIEPRFNPKRRKTEDILKGVKTE